MTFSIKLIKTGHVIISDSDQFHFHSASLACNHQNNYIFIERVWKPFKINLLKLKQVSHRIEFQ